MSGCLPPKLHKWTLEDGTEVSSGLEPQSNTSVVDTIQKPELSLIPGSALVHTALAFKDGALKRSPYNWREKDQEVSSMNLVNKTLRHIQMYIDGQDYSEDAKVLHIAHAIADLMILIDAQETGHLFDNRPPKGQTAHLIKRYTK